MPNMPKHASPTIRGLSPETRAALERRAQAKGHDLESEVRAVLDAAAAEQSDFPDWFLAMIEPGEDDIADFLDHRRAPHKPAKL